ncbi:UbiA family prenyltransferase [Amycolatopsis sp. NPDC059657]|uniref:UbiA family prenyltransferase n=1 Tax=Amycolatopsis sp. NPDC059657 TaxID=3346899 RepID=UPI00366CB023
MVSAHVQTWRPYTLAYPGLVGMAGAALPPGQPSWAQLALAWAAATLGWVSGHYLGDYFDRELDAISKPQRPIPSGRLPARTARSTGIGLAGLVLATLLVVNWRVSLLALLTVVVMVSYGAFLKSHGLYGNFARGTATGLALVCGSMLTHPVPPPMTMLAALAFLCHDTASNLVGTLRDIDGDERGGYLTFPVRYGVRATVRLVAILYTAAVVMVFAVVPDSALLFGAAAFGVASLWTLRTVSPGRALRAHELLVIERLLLAAALLPPKIGFIVLIPALALTLPTQRRMRAPYEFPEGHRA